MSGPGPELALDGPGAPPRLNGELVFDAPWQARAFGMAAGLVEAGQIDWPQFQAALIERVGRADADHTDTEQTHADRTDTGRPAVYWQCWLEALGELLEGVGILGPDDWSVRSRQLAGRPAGHDH